MRSSPPPTGSAVIWEWVSAWISAISFAIRRARLEAMVTEVLDRVAEVMEVGVDIDVQGGGHGQKVVVEQQNVSIYWRC